MSSPTSFLGRLGGVMLAPLTGFLASLRHARSLLHARGVVYRAELRPVAGVDARLAARIDGPALVRLSAALWQKREWPDVLGIAIRLRGSTEVSGRPQTGDQDLLFATVRRPWQLMLAPLLTFQHDYLANAYHAVSPFEDDDLGTVRWRLTPSVGATDMCQTGSRGERLARAVAAGTASFQLEVSPAADESAYHTVAELILLEALDLDQHALHFSPFRDGHGIHPRGFIHSLRPTVYRSSRAADV